MKLSHGAEIDIDRPTFDGDVATVEWWWVRDMLGRDLDSGTNVVRFRWKYTGEITTPAGKASTYDVDLIDTSGDVPSREILAYCEDVVTEAIPSHLDETTENA